MTKTAIAAAIPRMTPPLIHYCKSRTSVTGGGFLGGFGRRVFLPGFSGVPVVVRGSSTGSCSVVVILIFCSGVGCLGVDSEAGGGGVGVGSATGVGCCGV